MRILAFTDLHAGITAYKKLLLKVKKFNPDLLICTGDFTIFEQNIEPVLGKIAELGKPVLLIHGNHESDAIVAKIAKRHPNIAFIHNKFHKIGEYTFIGHGGGGFYGQGDNLEGDEEFEELIRQNKRKLKGKLVLLTHAPPARTKLDYIDWIGDHVGCTSYTDFINKYNPLLALSGHLHENFCVKEKYGKTVLLNPGPEGMIIEL